MRRTNEMLQNLLYHFILIDVFLQRPKDIFYIFILCHTFSRNEKKHPWVFVVHTIYK